MLEFIEDSDVVRKLSNLKGIKKDCLEDFLTVIVERIRECESEEITLLYIQEGRRLLQEIK